MLFNKKTLGVYITTDKLYYIIKKDDENHYYEEIDIENEDENIKIISITNALRKIKKDNKVRKIIIAIEDYNRFTKIIEKEEPINKNISLIVKEEVKTNLQATENIEDLVIRHLQIDKLKKRFLITTYNRPYINKLCNVCEKENLDIHCITIPEIGLLNIIKNRNGNNLLIYKNENTFKAVVVKDNELIYTISFNIDTDDILIAEIQRIKDYIFNKLNQNIDNIFLIGDVKKEDLITTNDLNLNDFSYGSIPDKYLIPLGILMKG